MDDEDQEKNGFRRGEKVAFFMFSKGRGISS